MSNPYKSYLSIGEKLDKNKFILATFYLQSQDQPPARNATQAFAGGFDRTAGGVAAESSVGTWTDVSLQEKTLWDKLHGRVIELDEAPGAIKIAYPLELFERGNIPQFLSSIAGNVFGLAEISSLRLVDIELPGVYVRSFPGPALGIEGIRRTTGISDRPLLGSIIKPKLGLSSVDHIHAAMEVYEGGVDLVKDDENLTSQSFNSFYTRVDEGTKRMSKTGYLAKGKEKIYAYNITASFEEMVKRAEYVVVRRGNCIMMDILTVGFAGVCGIRNKNFGKIIHGHRAMHAALTRSRDYGISMLVIAKLARLAGVDTLHTGTIVGKMEGGKEEVLAINHFLRGEWYGLKTVLPVASGGLHPGHMTSLVHLLGDDMLFNFGGGIHGHPQGSRSGAKAVVAALEAVKQKIPLEQYAETHTELASALSKWK